MLTCVWLLAVACYCDCHSENSASHLRTIMRDTYCYAGFAFHKNLVRVLGKAFNPLEVLPCLESKDT
jgi:DUF1365 family protein